MRRQQTSSSHRAAFTLIEVLIALSLSLLLLTAVYAAIGMHFRYTTLGRSTQERNQISRAIIRRMSQDFTSIIFRLPEEESEEDDTVVQDEAEVVNNSALTIEGIEDGAAPITFGLIGTADLLHLSISKPSRDLNYEAVVTDEPLSGRKSDLIAATYGLAPVDNMLTLDALGQPVRQSSFVNSNQPDSGFGRRLIDLYATQSSAEELDETHVLAPEISEVSFKYYDGESWFDEWDSRVTGVLPRAVEVTLGFWNEPPKNTQQRGLNLNTSSPVTYLSYVFHLPLSVPQVVL